ncbi:Diacylglycerol kinase [Candidatus Hydrogenisulfobacillus filiaventi]|uniref:Diacylglycerol kinase n=1 Tax=Candidatus Hydrogenisulfobacillus filiaventi TaxID=2707344 RepID=A0A6F8ZDT5_9FIRM|nr:Diacylglycerol kinase [Candidatus Hydrogenisulfobacillus filiaventi]
MGPAILIYNPAAGNGHARRVYESLRPELERRGVEVRATEGPGHATDIARGLAGEAVTVVSLGGDGTHHEVVNGLGPHARAVLAVIPAGTGNDFARVLDLPPDPLGCLAVALDEPGPQGPRIRQLDLGQVNRTYFLTVAGIGFDAEVAGWVNARQSRKGSGTWTFVRGILANLFTYRFRPLEVHVGEAARRRETFMLTAGNTPFYAGGIHICPGADPTDGLLTVLWVGRLPRLEVLPLLVKAYRGNHTGHPAVETFNAARLEVNGPPELWVDADGELIGHLPVTLGVVPKALAVRAGAGA